MKQRGAGWAEARHPGRTRGSGAQVLPGRPPGLASRGGASTAIRAAARKEAPGRRQPRAAAAVATAGSGAPRKALPGALRGSWSGQQGVGVESGRVVLGGNDPERRAGKGGGGGGGGPAVEAPRCAEPEEGDAERACLAPGGPANVTVSLAERSHPLTLRLTSTLAPKPAPPRNRGVPGIGPTFSEPAAAAAPSSRLRPLAPAGVGSRGPALPSPLGCPRRLHHIPPWSVAHARGRARGSGAQGFAYIARLLLAAHTVHGREGASEGGTGPSAVPAAAAAPEPSSAPPVPRRPPHWDPAAGVPAPSPPPPPPPLPPDQWVEGSRILLAISSLRVFAGAFSLFVLRMRRTIFIIWDSLSPTSLRGREGRNSVVLSLWRVPAARRLLKKKTPKTKKLREKSRLPSRAARRWPRGKLRGGL
ncbi:WAS/WASL-interacting protein family member 1-like [Bos indicus x Bos taurus]|uniref:WAS/WASL-interacting protein family member 1-like n=1 Tax=Bos indicus x Bos taurus TaxID=30522 RepID=UPI000383BA36|nr:WAS/WASL-interacting protein family member 1-like [Bos indicus x Bos taurus]